MRNGSSGFPEDYEMIEVNLQAINSYRASVTVTVHGAQIWRPPVQLDLDYKTTSEDERLFRLEHDQTFVKVIRKETNQIIWQMNYRNLIFSEQWLQAETHLPSLDLFGLGDYKDTYRKKIDRERKSFLVS